MDFESPDVMKDFPGLYASDLHKTKCNDTDYSDDAEKIAKKDGLIGKRKDKKDKKDKDRGYAALEGESSAEESFEVRSPSKSKKSKSFKFPSKSKEKREKDVTEKKKDKDKKTDKKIEKEKDKNKVDKKERKVKCEEWSDIGEVLPIFGVSLKLALERGRCHDGIDLPVPVRACIEYVEKNGLTFEGVYKVGGAKSKAAHLKKLYNQRENVDLSEYDVPTVTSLLKLFLRDLTEPIFTSELLVRFEEAGAILNVTMREKHLKILVGNLPSCNRLLLSWIIVHLYNVTLNERCNKMNAQSISLCLSSTLQTSHRLLTALLYHCPVLFPNVVLEPYIGPLATTSQLPDDLESMACELSKQESLLAQIHAEMHLGFISKQREELLWEVQRIITQLKRKLKTAIKDKEGGTDKNSDTKQSEDEKVEDTTSICDSESLPAPTLNDDVDASKTVEVSNNEATLSNTSSVTSLDLSSKEIEKSVADACVIPVQEQQDVIDKRLTILQLKNDLLNELKQSLLKQIEDEKVEISTLKEQISSHFICSMIPVNTTGTNSSGLDEIMFLLRKENQILQIKKINLVRQIMEQQEACIDLKIQFEAF